MMVGKERLDTLNPWIQRRRQEGEAGMRGSLLLGGFHVDDLGKVVQSMHTQALNARAMRTIAMAALAHT